MTQSQQVINNQKPKTLPILLEDTVDAVSKAEEAQLNAVTPAAIKGDSGVLLFLVLLIVALIIAIGAVGVISKLRFIQADMQQGPPAQSVEMSTAP